MRHGSHERSSTISAHLNNQPQQVLTAPWQTASPTGMPATEDPRIRRVRTLRDQARADPGAVEPADVTPFLEVNEPVVRRTAIETLLTIARERPAAVADGVPKIVGLLGTTDHRGEQQLIETLATVAAAEPDVVAPHAAAVGARLRPHASAQLIEGGTRVLAHVARARPSALLSLVPKLAVVLEDADPQARRNVLSALSYLAASHPDTVRPLVPTLVTCLEEDDPATLQATLATLGRLVAAFPIESSVLLDEVLTLFEHDSTAVRANAVGLLGDALQHEHLSAPEVRSALTDALEDEAAPVRANALTALARLAVDREVDISVAQGAIVDGLDDDDARVRERTCYVIGIAELAVDPDRLTTLIDTDPDADVVERALWARDRIQ